MRLFFNRQWEIKIRNHWMAVPPRLTKLGAKWVEVRKRRARLPSGLVSVFENVASNTR